MLKDKTIVLSYSNSKSTILTDEKPLQSRGLKRRNKKDKARGLFPVGPTILQETCDFNEGLPRSWTGLFDGNQEE